MIELVIFTCPECGIKWVEKQDTDDDWFRLAIKQTLCEDCSQKYLKYFLMSEEQFVKEVFE